MAKANPAAIKSWTLRIETLETVKRDATTQVEWSNAEKDLAYAWDRLRAARGK